MAVEKKTVEVILVDYDISMLAAFITFFDYLAFYSSRKYRRGRKLEFG